MNIKDIKIGDKLCVPHDGFPMVVVGILSSLDDLNNGTVYLDFEENKNKHSSVGRILFMVDIHCNGTYEPCRVQRYKHDTMGCSTKRGDGCV